LKREDKQAHRADSTITIIGKIQNQLSTSPSMPNPLVFFDVTIGGAPAGRIEIELFVGSLNQPLSLDSF
jgi:hypothetical protein